MYCILPILGAGMFFSYVLFTVVTPMPTSVLSTHYMHIIYLLSKEMNE